METYDIAVVGAGIAGASAAHELSTLGRVVLLERERMPGYHSTGRSAAVFTENYGVETIRRLTAASRAFLESPPPGFTEHPILAPRPVLWLARPDQMATLEAMHASAIRLVPSIRMIDVEEMLRICPVLERDYVAGGMLEPDATDMDVAALHQGYLRAFRARDGQVRSNFEVVRITRSGDGWKVDSPGESVSCGIVVNAAGAWCDRLAQLAGAKAVGLTPRRRTAFVFEVASEFDTRNWPSVIDSDEEFYFKPESGGVLGSPADETPVSPCDVQPEMLDIAQAIDRIQKATTLTIDRLRNKWAGLRSFVADGAPVVGMEPDTPGFFWLAGQGGYGIMTAPAMSRAVAGLMEHGDLPVDLRKMGITREGLSPSRLRSAPRC